MGSMAKAKTVDHTWSDDALRPDGKAWQAGIAFTCTTCGLLRRGVQGEGMHVGKGHADGKVSWIYFVTVGGEAKRVGILPECTP